MEEIIYILLGVAWVAYSLFSQGKKKKQQPRARAEEETSNAGEPEEPISELEKIFMGEKYEFESAGERISSEFQENETSFEEKVDKPEEKAKLPVEGKRMFGSDKDENETGVASQESDWVLDLRRAIIYQAILERPNY